MNRAPHQPNQPFRHDQANAGALFRAVFLAKPVKRLEQLTDLLG